MQGQLSIFDWMPSLSNFPDINDITEAECVRLIGERIGVTFAYNPKFEQWEAKIGKLTLSIEYDHYSLDDNNNLFIGCGWKRSTSGGGAPIDTIEKACEWLERRMVT